MNLQSLDINSGESRTLTLYARDSRNVPAIISVGKTITWTLGRKPSDPEAKRAILTKSGTVTDAAAGKFTVALTTSDTEGLEGEYWHQAVMVDGSNKAVVTAGPLYVRRGIES